MVVFLYLHFLLNKSNNGNNTEQEDDSDGAVNYLAQGKPQAILTIG